MPTQAIDDAEQAEEAEQQHVEAALGDELVQDTATVSRMSGSARPGNSDQIAALTAGSDVAGVARESQDERRADGSALLERHESLAPPVGFRPVVPDVADDADDPARAQKLDDPADRIFSGKVTSWPRRR